MSKNSYVISIFIALLIFCAPLSAEPCPDHVTADLWVKSFNDGIAAQHNFLSQLKSCLPGHKSLQQEVDDLAVETLDTLGEHASELQKPLAEFVVDAFRVNADASFPSSQHNYAALHNAEPGSLVQQLVPQSYSVFIYWSKKAAAQKEPRALFNLAIRMADDNPPEGIKTDIAGAYVIFTYLMHTNDLPRNFMSYVNAMRKELSKKLGKRQAQKLDAAWKTIDFSKLAPKEEK